MTRKMFLAMIVVLFLSGMAHAKTYKIATVAWAGWSPANVADAKGFWKEEGVDVKVATTPNPQGVLDLFKNKRVDIGFDMIGSLVGFYMEGMPIVIIAETNWSHGGDKIIVKKNLNPNVLKGKPVGVYYNVPSVAYFLNRYLSTIGLKLADTRVIEMEPSKLADHFIDKRFGAIVCYDPEAIRAERSGNGTVVATTATYEGCMPEGMMMLQDTLKDIPEADLVKIFKGWVKAVKWSQDPANWKEYMDILNKHTFKGDSPYSEKDLRDMVNAVRIHDESSQFERNQYGGGLYAYLSDLRAFLAENKLLKKDFKPEEIFNNTAIIKALNPY